jgi:MFS family permease
MFAYRAVHSIPALIAVRFLHGFCWAFAATAVTTVVAGFLPRTRLGEGMGIFTMAIGIAMAVAPAIGFSIAEWKGFDSLFLLCAATIVTALILSFFLRTNAHSEPKKAKTGERATPLLFSAVPAALLISAVAVVSSSISSFLPFYAQQLGSPSAVPFFTLSAGLLLLSRPVAGKLMDCYPARVVLVPSLVFLCVSCALLAAAPFSGWMLAAAAAHGLAFGSLLGGLQTLALVGVDRSHYGAATSTFFLGFDVGNGLGPLIAGALADAIGYRGSYATLALLPLLAALLFCFRRKNKSRGR